MKNIVDRTTEELEDRLNEINHEFYLIPWDDAEEAGLLEEESEIMAELRRREKENE